MAIRSRLRRAFTRGAEDDPNLASKMSKGKGRANTDPNVYQPGEKMPPLKYRRPAAPEHTALLESFDWAKAWRPRSIYSVYSPMGSPAASRRNSFVAPEMPSTAEAPSTARRSKDFLRSDDDSIVDSGVGASVAGDDEPPELHDEGDEGDESGEMNDAKISSTMNGTPFTQEDLELALQRSNIDTTKNDSCASSTAAPINQHICTPGKCTIFHMDRLHERGTLLTA